jgi:nucleotide-binding universal stress UspA family protein
MFKRILVPLDGSLRAEKALPVAVRIARSSGGSLLLLRVVGTSIEFWPYLAPQAQLLQNSIDASLEVASRYLTAVSKTLEGVPVETMTLFGSTASVILSVAYEQGVDLLVMCSHGYTGITRWVMGSVAEKVARHAVAPVLILREGGPLPAAPHLDPIQPMRVLVPLDGSAYARSSIEPAAHLIAALAAPTQGALHLTRIVKPPAESVSVDPLSMEEREHILHKAKSYLRSTTEQIHGGLVGQHVSELNLAITWSVAIDTDVATAIVRVAENGEDAEGAGVLGGCDVIAIATHGYGGLQRWAIGSTTERVLNATKLPVLVVRPPDIIDRTLFANDKSATSVVQG